MADKQFFSITKTLTLLFQVDYYSAVTNYSQEHRACHDLFREECVMLFAEMHY